MIPLTPSEKDAIRKSTGLDFVEGDSTRADLIAELRRGDGNGCRHANELMRRAADALEASLPMISDLYGRF